MSEIRIETARQFIEHQHTLGLYCRPCERWTVADLQLLIDRGQGDEPIVGPDRMQFKCKDCGTRMERQVRPPTVNSPWR